MARNYERITTYYECVVHFKQGKPKTYTLATYDKLIELEDSCLKNNAVHTVLSSRVEKSLYVKKYTK